MTRTNREAISEVINDLRLVNMDEYIPKKYVYYKLISYTDSLTKRDSDNRRIFNHRYLFKTIPCVNLVTVVNDCCEELPMDYMFKRTEVQLPQMLSTIYKSQISVRPVMGFGGYQFVETTPRQYSNIVRRPYKDPNIVYFWISDKYLYFPDTTLEAVTVEGPFTDILEYVKLLNSDECIRILDMPFTCPDYLYEDVKALCVKDIGMGLQRPTDESLDLNSNSKTQTHVD
jgi:hypothetical protein